MTTCSPTTPVIKAKGLPVGLQLTDNGNGTATISGTPSLTDASGVHTAVITATVTGQAPAVQNLAISLDTSPLIKSRAKFVAATGTGFSLPITATGYPVPVLSTVSPLPAGVTFVANNNGSATLGGTPGPGTGGAYPVTINAHNAAGTVTQNFVLEVDQAPSITAPTAVTATDGVSITPITLSDSGYPAPAIRAGGRPPGIQLVNNGNGTAVLSGSPNPTDGPGVKTITVFAVNRAGRATQTITMTLSR